MIVALSAFFLCLLTGKSLSAQERPGWCDDGSRTYDKSYTRVYSASGYDEDKLRDKIIERIVIERGLTGQHADISSQNKNVKISYNNELYLKARVIDEYVEYNDDSQYPITVWQLVQVAKNPSYDFENVYVSGEYPFSARVFVPGMAQIYKGSKTKAICLISAETFFVGGIVVACVLHSSYDGKFHATHNTGLQRNYANSANVCAIAGNVAIAGAAAVYVWNIIDGVAAKGGKRLFIGKQFSSNSDIRMIPYATSNGAGFTMNINF